MSYQPADIRLAWLRNLFLLRRTVRQRIKAQDAMHTLTRALERQAKLHEMASPPRPFLARQARDGIALVRAEFDAMHPRPLKEYGKLILDMAPHIDRWTTLQDRCDALNINIADRHSLKESDGIVSLIFAHALEDSAMHRRCQDNFSRPLFRVTQLVFFEWMARTPEGKEASDKAFSEVFGDVLPLPGEQPLSGSQAGTYGKRRGKLIFPAPSTLQ